MMSDPNNWKDVPNLQKGQLPSDDHYATMIDATFNPVITNAKNFSKMKNLTQLNLTNGIVFDSWEFLKQMG